MSSYLKLSFFSVCVLATLLFSCKNQGKDDQTNRKSKYHDLINIPTTQEGTIDSTQLSKIEVLSKTHDFGNVKEGQIVAHSFTIKNIGTEDLYVVDSKSACGCTISEYPKTAIPPGKSDDIKITFDTKRKEGLQEKKVSIFTNSVPNETIFAIKANVIK